MSMSVERRIDVQRGPAAANHLRGAPVGAFCKTAKSVAGEFGGQPSQERNRGPSYSGKDSRLLIANTLF
jgi:hypothetical protein